MRITVLLTLITCAAAVAQSTKPATRPGPGDEMLARYFQQEVQRIEQRTAAELRDPAWVQQREAERKQLMEMIGLDPMPQRTDLKPVITGKVDHEPFTIEKLYFQSMPRLYVTANLYIPKGLTKPAPAVLYVCGHGNVKKNNISYGAKASYQHHGAWFARNGYVCMVIDTLQLGEIEGDHHGTYRLGQWWWISRGYTPAGVEAWNATRSIDYLISRPEVDKERLGVTGRSGGGAYSWWLGAIDPRVKAIAPVAGITDLRNHVIDGCVEGHCDCMFMVNTYRWDYAKVAALHSPRALRLLNTDRDTIFPLDGVMRVHELVREVYRNQNAEANFGLIIAEGPHKDTQDLQVPAFRFMARHLKKDEGPAEPVATKLFEPEQLKVYAGAPPEDQINTKVQQSFVPMAPPAKVPADKAEWEGMKAGWMKGLAEKVFAGWPEQMKAKIEWKDGAEGVRTGQLVVQEQWRLPVWMVRGKEPALRLRVIVPAVPGPALLREADTAMVALRGVGPTAFGGDAKKQIQIQRRFYLIGQTLDGMRVYDLLAALKAMEASEIELVGDGEMAGVALYAALYEPRVTSLRLKKLPASSMQGPILLNVLKVLDTPAVLAMVAERAPITLEETDPAVAEYATEVGKKLGWPADRLRVVGKP